MLVSLCILTLFMTVQPAGAGNVVEKPDPELLKKFEAERDAAAADLQRAQKLRDEGDALIREADEADRKAHEETVRELCAIGALPASECP